MRSKKLFPAKYIESIYYESVARYAHCSYTTAARDALIRIENEATMLAHAAPRGSADSLLALLRFLTSYITVNNYNKAIK